MLKSLAVAGTLGVLATLTVAPSTDAATSTYAVQIKERPSKIHGNGSVTIKFWLRCAEGFNAFEYSVGVRQGDTFGGAGGGPEAFILPCDGTRHKHAVHVFPESGSWTRGYADVDMNVQIFDGDSDISAEDSARVWLKR